MSDVKLRIRKRSGAEADFDPDKIVRAIRNANASVNPGERLPEEAITQIANDIMQKYLQGHTMPTVEGVQDDVIFELMRHGAYRLANNYIVYRYQHANRRNMSDLDKKIMAIVGGLSAEAKEENSNKNTEIIPTQRDYIAGEVSRDLTRRVLLPPDIMAAHDEGRIHFHDADYAIQNSHNCGVYNFDDMLQNGTVITGTKIDKPHKFSTTCNIATQLVAQIASCSYGGQTLSLTHLAKFVDMSRQTIRSEVTREIAEAGLDMTPEQIEQVVEMRVKKDVAAGIQTIQYQVLTLMTTNGQAPFITLYMCLGEAGDDQQLKNDLAMCIEEVLKQRILGVKNTEGVYITPAFPKLIYVTDEDNVHEDSPYFYLTYLAAQCTAKRMVPDYVSAKKCRELKGDVYGPMGCRSFLTPDRFTDAGIGNIANAMNYKPGKHKYYGRFNQGVVTINLPFVAMASNKDLDVFWKEFDATLEMCHRALRIRHEHLKGTPSDVAPVLWQYGALARLKKGETIDKLLFNGYSTISLGYAGLYEAVMYLTGHSHTDPEGKPLALQIMQHMNDKCAEWKAAENIDYSLYGTPLESTTYKFAKALRAKFGIVKDVSDHDYITNSYHVCVRENIDAFQKLNFEAEFQALSPGGAISYVEVPNLQNNVEAIISVIQYMYDNILYAELNTKSDYCQVCGYDGEIKIVEEGGKLIWECPNCHNRDQHKMNVCRRTCGYLGTQFWNQGRTQEIKDRVLHL